MLSDRRKLCRSQLRSGHFGDARFQAADETRWASVGEQDRTRYRGLRYLEEALNGGNQRTLEGSLSYDGMILVLSSDAKFLREMY